MHVVLRLLKVYQNTGYFFSFTQAFTEKIVSIEPPTSKSQNNLSSRNKEKSLKNLRRMLNIMSHVQSCMSRLFDFIITTNFIR